MVYRLLLIIFKVYVVFNLIKFFREIYYKFLVKYIKKPVVLKNMGEWAVITGCTEGIGKEYAIELAKQGLNTILISRNKKKLEALSQEIREKYNVKTKVVVADFIDSKAAVPIIKKELANFDIGILINNVGAAPKAGPFLELSKEEVNALIEINMMSMVNMCDIVLPGMLEKRKALIVNVSSMSATFASPNITLYGATKAFMVKFSKDLSIEYEKFGITIQCLVPSVIATRMSNAPTCFIFPTANQYVRSALQTVGLRKVCTGWCVHDIAETIFFWLGDISPSLQATFMDFSIKQGVETFKPEATLTTTRIS